MVMPRADFGVREAQLQELRARRDALKQAAAASGDGLADDVRAALYEVDAAERKLRLHADELVPLAERTLETTRGAYEGARTGYLELIDAARGLLKARLGRIDAMRALADAHARLLAAVGTGRSKS
jgi:outer membrane protein TolC